MLLVLLYKKVVVVGVTTVGIVFIVKVVVGGVLVGVVVFVVTIDKMLL